MSFPAVRMRRLRQSEAWRGMVRETSLGVEHLVYPLFVCPGENVRRPIASMPGCYQFSVDAIVEEAREVHRLGIPAVLLFGIPSRKDAHGSEAYSDDGIIPHALRALKQAVPELLLWADVCLCEYTAHGHCGVVREGHVDNDATLDLLTRMALTCARAGADAVCPSDMMDGRVGVIRQALDAEKFPGLPIVSYAAKYASGFYGPFREAAESAPHFGDRRGYQMDPANADEALREVALDIEEGADIVIVKPALAYLDVVRRVKERFQVPVAAYNVSGEYAMLHAAAERGWIDGPRVLREVLLSIRRAGADIIITYSAKDYARALAAEKIPPGPA